MSERWDVRAAALRTVSVCVDAEGHHDQPAGEPFLDIEDTEAVRTSRRFCRHPDLLAAFKGLDPERRHSAMLAYVEAVAECEAKARLPLAAPPALNARTAAKLAKWRDPAMLVKLANAYARAQDHEEAARLLGVTVGAARLAKRRHLDRAATDPGAESS